MSLPMNPQGRTRLRALARRALFSLVLGAVITLVLCLLFAHWSVTTGRTAWRNLAHRNGTPARITHESSVGKSVITWAPLRDREHADILEEAKTDARAIRPGGHVPPSWSSYWNDREFLSAHTATQGMARERQDYAVGWPCRAFVATRYWDPESEPVRYHWRDARPLPTLVMGDSAAFGAVEFRAVPLRPHLPGLFADVSCWSAAAFLVLSTTSRRQRVAYPGFASGRPIRARFTRAAIVASAGAGLALTILTGVVLPICMPLRSVNFWSTERPYTGGTRSLFWRQHATRDDSAAIAQLDSYEAARVFEARFLNDRTTTEPHLRKRGPRDEIDAGGPHWFQSTRTGYPFSILSGATWHIVDLNPRRQRAGLVDARRVRHLAPTIVHGLRDMATRPLWFGWIANTAIYATLSLILLVAFDLQRQRRRRFRGLCPRCAYDLRGTAAEAPCPECGDV